MNIPTHHTSRLLLIAALFSSQAIAEHPGHGHHGHRREQMENRHQQEYYQPPAHEFNRPPREQYFSENHRGLIRDYYIGEYRIGRCPPGLRKKANGCLPPGHGKRWVLGRRLPRDVIYYDLPPSLIREIGYPPPGYRLVRVASDILMIAVGTGLVMDAIADINGVP